MPRFLFRYEIADDGLTITLYRKSVLGKDTAVPPEHWADKMGDAAFAGVAHVLASLEADDGRAAPSGNGVLLSHATVATLTEPQADGLGLPPASPFILNLRAEHRITEPDFDLRATWIDHTSRPMYAKRRGSLITIGEQVYRIPEPQFSISEAVDAFRAADTRDDGRRLAALARLQALFPDEGRERLLLDPYMRNFRVLHATAFSLSLRTDGKSFQFDPILFGRHVKERAARRKEEQDNDTDLGGAIVSEAEGLLTDRQQELFATNRFQKYAEARDRYVIESGVYIYLDPTLKDALSVVRKLQASDDEARKRFARSPQLYLKEELGDRYDEAAVEHVFIETEQYSERVVDIGLWAPPVLPWIIPDPNDWLPERFGIQVGGRYVALAAEDLPELRRLIEAAVESGQSKVTFKGEELPANQATRDALASLIGIVRPKTQEPDDGTAREDEAKPEKHVLVVSENFEQIDFTHNLRPRAAELISEVPAAVKTALKPHQTSGIVWLQETWAKGYPGVLLADDMGLGKTFQALGFLAWLRELSEADPALRSEPILIVAPTGLLRNWEDEHDTHLYDPGLGQVCRAYGSHLGRIKKAKVRDIETGIPSLDDKAMRECKWVLTTYETLRDYHFSFAKVRFACVVLDEMQKAKNPASLLTRAAKTLNGRFMIGLTGTPIENRLEDLWAIMDILDPGRLGDLKSFSATYKAENPDSLERLRGMLLDPSVDGPAPVLRRMKADHIEALPEKRVHVRRRKMPDTQARAYAEIVARAKSEDAGSMLETLHHLRGVSLHPVWPQTGTINDPNTYISQSARLAETFDILDEVARRNEKALIFLESLDMQDQLSLIIKKRYGLARTPMQINGELSGDKRKKAVDEFQKVRGSFDVMILSPKAGGVGLTLTAANHVIHLSRWWNPAVEDQCTDRIYRIGQNQDVHVYYPMAVHPDFGAGSFDEILNGLLDRKRELGRRMLIPPVNRKQDETWFSERLMQKERPKIEPTDLDEIDRMEPLQFERWALSRLAGLGYIADRTPRSHDAGADGIMVHRQTKELAIVQCKLRQRNDQFCSDEPIDDLLRARSAYGASAMKLIALTNATDFTDKAKRRARDYGVLLVSRKALPQWPVGYV